MTVFRRKNLAFVTLLFLSFPVFAEEEDPLKATQNLLGNAEERSKVIEKDERAKQADAQVKGLGLDAAGQEQIYQVSGKILETLSKETGGDPEKMMEKVQGYMRNPSALEKDITPEEKAKIEELSKQAKPAQ